MDWKRLKETLVPGNEIKCSWDVRNHLTALNELRLLGLIYLLRRGGPVDTQAERPLAACEKAGWAQAVRRRGDGPREGGQAGGEEFQKTRVSRPFPQTEGW